VTLPPSLMRVRIVLSGGVKFHSKTVCPFSGIEKDTKEQASILTD